MVVDTIVDTWVDGKVTSNVKLLSAFAGKRGGEFVANVTQEVVVHLPEPECVEYIADKIGPYEFVSLDSACLIRDVWNVFRENSDVIDCVVHGMLAGGRIKQLPDWTNWTSCYPFMSPSR